LITVSVAEDEELVVVAGAMISAVKHEALTGDAEDNGARKRTERPSLLSKDQVRAVDQAEIVNRQVCADPFVLIIYLNLPLDIFINLFSSGW
jgi:hypothetical protein